MNKGQIIQEIKSAAERHGLNPAIVYGVAMQESLLNPYAVRYEPKYRWIYLGAPGERLQPALCSWDTELILQRTSIGLMQVMGAVYREYGYRGWLTAILGSLTWQIEYGCRHLAAKIKAFGEIQGVAAYNSGSPVFDGGRIKNQYYVDAVFRHAKEWSL